MRVKLPVVKRGLVYSSYEINDYHKRLQELQKARQTAIDLHSEATAKNELKTLNSLLELTQAIYLHMLERNQKAMRHYGR